MPQLDNYLVTLGMKGQNIVLSQMDKIRKKGKDLTKKKTIDLTAKASAGQAPAPNPQQEKSDKKREKSDKTQERSTNKFKRSAETVNNAMNRFAGAAATLDPTATIQGATSAVAKAVGGVSIMGNNISGLVSGIADIANTMLGMAKNTVDVAKQSASQMYGLQQRNTTVGHYGGGSVNAEAAAAGMSNSEYSSMMMRVIASNGKIDTSLRTMVTELAKTKDVAQLGNVASGNFESVGTNKGWMMQQIFDGMGNVPPEIRQKMMKSLLPKIQDDIMSNKGQDARTTNADWERANEAQTAEKYKAANIPGVSTLNTKLNTLEIQLIEAGAGMASAIDTASEKITNLTKDYEEMNKKFNTLKDSLGDVTTAAKSFAGSLKNSVKGYLGIRPER